jgi:hypothetical protein
MRCYSIVCEFGCLRNGKTVEPTKKHNNRAWYTFPLANDIGELLPVEKTCIVKCLWNLFQLKI